MSAWKTEFRTDLANPNAAATHIDIRVIANAFGSDFNGTALVDNFILSTIDSADFDADDDVDGIDFLSWQRGFGLDSSLARSNGDASGDNDVDAEDFSVWESQFGDNPIFPLSAVTGVPEPSTGFFLLQGMFFCVSLAVNWNRRKTLHAIAI